MDLDKLLELGNKCIHSEPPACSAGCPVNLDVRNFMMEIEKGDLKKAYKLMESKIPLTKIIGRICDRPCESSCVRKNYGGSIAIGELEKAIIQLGSFDSKKRIPIPKNKGKVAVVGGGLSGIVAAIDLDKKGYKVSIYEKESKIGGRIWNFSGKEIPEEIINEELSIIYNSNIEINNNFEANEEDLRKFIDDFDAVYLGTSQWEKEYEVDKVTLKVENYPIFIGGKLSGEESVIFSAGSGRRAAISIDRFIKKASMTVGREREGTYQTLLDYNGTGETYIPLTEKLGEFYSETEMIEEARRCFKCQCNECIEACVHLQHFNITPDEYVRRINHNERIILGTHFANKMINSCTECGLCKEKCPVDIDMKEIIHATRRSMVERKKMPISAHDFALKDMKFSSSSQFEMVRKQPSKEQSKSLFYYPVIAFSKYARGLYKGSGKTGYLFYPGCQLSSTHTEYIGDIYKHLVGAIKENDAERDVGIYLGCCGAPADWAGRDDLMNQNAEKIKKTWLDMEKPIFIMACSSCISTFKKYLPMIETVSLWEILDKYGLPEVDIKQGKRILNIHDACSTRDDEKLQESIRSIAKTLGYKINELKYSKDKAKCCGYGGLVTYANKEQAEKFASDIKNDSEEDLLVYCAMCKDSLIKSGKKTYHIIDIIYGKEIKSVSDEKMPSLSERHNKRKKLKHDLLKEIWGENQEEDINESYDFEIVLSDEVKEKMEKRFILMEDILKVIDNSKKTNKRFYNKVTSDYLARLPIENVTFWVQYKEQENKIYVNAVYSHRMEIVEE